MSFTPEQGAALAAPLDRTNVSERSQAGRKLSYIEGWHAIAEANRIFGFDGWTRETIETRCVAEKERKIGKDNPRDGWGVSYIAKVKVVVFAGDTLVTREGVGAGHGIDVDLGLAHESAIKEAETDAMKRAMMTFGNPFGLALYDKSQANVGTPAKPAQKPEEAFRRFEAAIVASTDEKALEGIYHTMTETPEAELSQGDFETLSAMVTARLAELRKPMAKVAPNFDNMTPAQQHAAANLHRSLGS